MESTRPRRNRIDRIVPPRITTICDLTVKANIEKLEEETNCIELHRIAISFGSVAKRKIFVHVQHTEIYRW